MGQNNDEAFGEIVGHGGFLGLRICFPLHSIWAWEVCFFPEQKKNSMLSQNGIDELYARINVLVKMTETSANACIK